MTTTPDPDAAALTPRTFDKPYWENRWADAGRGPGLPVNPYLATETAGLRIGTALDAGCGTGTEALWLADRGWRVTGADISGAALAVAAERAAAAGLGDRVDWVETDLTRWEPGREWDLLITSYAHSAAGQLALYRRIANWVAPGGTLLIVGHLHTAEESGHGRGHRHPEGSTAGLREIETLLAAPRWRIDAGYENTRTARANGRDILLRDVVARAQRVH